MNSNSFVSGTPTLREWTGLWRHSELEPPATADECQQAFDSLWTYLEKSYRVGSGDWDDLFLRGDFLGDRSQTLEIVYPPILSPALFEYLLKWNEGTKYKWRIIIPTFLGHRDAFIVYPETVRYEDLFGIPPKELCSERAAQMLCKPAFAHAKERAKEEGFLQ